MDKPGALGHRGAVTRPPLPRTAAPRRRGVGLLAVALVTAMPGCAKEPPPPGEAAPDAKAAAPAVATQPGGDPTAGPNERRGPLPPLTVEGRDVVVHEATSPYSRIQVVQTGSVRTLAFVQEGGTRWPQTVMDLAAPHRPAMKYLRAFALPLAYVPGASRALVVGLGGGALVAFLRHHRPDLEITAVELDPMVVQIAGEYFGVYPDAHTTMVAADGKAYVERDRGTYDIIFMDVFLEPSADGTDSSGVPRHLATVEFLRALRARLADGGVVAFNLHHKSSFGPHLRAIEAAFPAVQVVTVKGTGNRVVLAGETLPEEGAVRSNAAEIDATWDAGFRLTDQLPSPKPSPR